MPQIKAKRKKSLAVYLPVYFFTLMVNVLYGFGFNIPSPAVPIKELVDRVFGLRQGEAHAKKYDVRKAGDFCPHPVYHGKLARGRGNTDAKQDAWIAVLIAAFLFSPILVVYARLLCLYPGCGLYEIVLDVFGQVIGKALILLYVLYSMYLGALVMRDFSEFMQVVAIPETPQLITLLFMFAFCIWMATAILYPEL